MKHERSRKASSRPSADGDYTEVKDTTLQNISHSQSLEAAWDKDQSKGINVTDTQGTWQGGQPKVWQRPDVFLNCFQAELQEGGWSSKIKTAVVGRCVTDTPDEWISAKGEIRHSLALSVMR